MSTPHNHNDSDMPDFGENAESPPEETNAESPMTELEEARAKCEEYLQGWQRARADYKNLENDTQRRIAENSKYATERFLMELLPMVDHFIYAFQGLGEAERDSNWVKGFEHIQANFLKILEEHGLETIPTVGQPFDPQLHEAAEEVEGGTHGIVAEQVSAGFRLNGKVIKPARVKVYK